MKKKLAFYLIRIAGSLTVLAMSALGLREVEIQIIGKNQLHRLSCKKLMKKL